MRKLGTTDKLVLRKEERDGKEEMAEMIHNRELEKYREIKRLRKDKTFACEFCKLYGLLWLKYKDTYDLLMEIEHGVTKNN